MPLAPRPPQRPHTTQPRPAAARPAQPTVITPDPTPAPPAVAPAPAAAPLAVRQEFAALAPQNPEVNEAMADNLGEGASAFDLETVKTPTGGATFWTIPTLEGEERVETITGLIVYQQSVRGFWPGEFQGGSPPTCQSLDAKTGQGDPSGVCPQCPNAQFESAAKGHGQACKQMCRLFIVTKDRILPVLLVLAPTSLKAFRKYLVRLASAATAYWKCVTTIGLEKAQNADGISYSRATFKYTYKLSDDEAERVKVYRQKVELAFSARAVQPDEYLGQEMPDAEAQG